MKFNTKFYLLVLVGLISVSLVSSMPVIAFASDSFAQKTGEEYIWEVTTYVQGASVHESLEKVGNQLKIVIVETNTTYIGPCHYWDCLWIEFYNSTPSNTVWTLLFALDFWFYYNNSLGFEMKVEPFFIPRNETAVNASLAAYGYAHNEWTSGPHGYDGSYIGYDGNATGDLGAEKMAFDFISPGIMKYLEMYNGTGSGWDLVFRMEYQGGGIPGFLMNAVILALSFSVAIYALIHLKKWDLAL